MEGPVEGVEAMEGPMAGVMRRVIVMGWVIVMGGEGTHTMRESEVEKEVERVQGAAKAGAVKEAEKEAEKEVEKMLLLPAMTV
jgi:hypothetical protein